MALLAVLLSVPASSWSAPSLRESFARQAAAAGLPAADLPDVPVPAVGGARRVDTQAPRRIDAQAPRREAAEVVAYRSGRVDGSGHVTGSGYIHCSGSSLSGSVSFSGTIDVRGDDGVRGSIRVSGTAFVNGSCHNGNSSATVSVEVRGSDRVYDAEGRPAGTADVSGRIWAASIRSGSVFVSQYVNVSGWY